MPLRKGSSRSVVSQNIREMVAAGHPVDQAVATSLHNAHPRSKKMKDEGVNQHKSMAMGDGIHGDGETFGVQPFHNVNGSDSGMSHVPHPDAGTGVHNRHLHDHERGAKHPIKHDMEKMHAQANANHGPHDHHGSVMTRPSARGR